MTIQSWMLFIGLTFGLFIALILIVSFSLPRKKALDKTNDNNEWLWTNAREKIYDALFSNTDPLKICKSLGMRYDEYMVACNIIGKTPNFKIEAITRLIGVFFFLFSLPFCFLFDSIVPMLIGIAVFLICGQIESRTVLSRAVNKKERLLSEMPRFIDLLTAALEIGLPVETAIMQTADNIPCVFSDEIKQSFAEVQIGAKSWQKTLEDIAKKYEIDALSEFVLDITTAYDKGIPIIDSVKHQNVNLRQGAILRAKEKTAKLSNSIVMPIAIFKILPLIALLLIPVAVQIMRVFQ